MKKTLFITSYFLLITFFVDAQNSDSLKVKRDSSITPVDTFRTKHRANRAALFSAVVPGLGQIYNKKYWKPPIIYGGFIALGYSIEFNNRYYQIFKLAYQYRVDGDPTTVDDYETIYPESSALLTRRDYYRRTRDLMWIITSGVYLLNIIDAYVDAHLSDFDISDDLTLNAQPGLQFAFDKSPMPSLALTFQFK